MNLLKGLINVEFPKINLNIYIINYDPIFSLISYSSHTLIWCSHMDIRQTHSHKQSTL